MKSIKGLVIHGNKKGQKLGFPTANVRVDFDLNLETGVYAGYVLFDEKKYQSAFFFGDNKIIEAFIFDFAEDLYGKEIEILIDRKIRDKYKFKNDQEAIFQITKDVENIKKLLKK